ncbi:MAG: gliding motility protein GldM [Phycisphaerales bacterium]|nr:gliding motility protein GldM [Phycisphaerales bacterium]
MSLPEEPRQKMVNIMYLVLTALLALNVSAEVLNAFRTLNKSLENSNALIDVSNKNIMDVFNKKLNDNKSKAKALEWYPYAKKIADNSDSAYNYIERLKLQLKVEAGGTKVNPIGNKEPYANYRGDDLDAATRMFVSFGENSNSKPGGDILLKHLTDYVNSVKAIETQQPSLKGEIESKIRVNLEVPVSEEGKESTPSWATSYFRLTPAIAALAILTKFQNDIRNTEGDLLGYFLKKVGEVDFIIDQYAGIAYLNSEVLLPGSPLVVKAGLGAFSKSAKPSIYVNGNLVSGEQDGIPTYSTVAESTPGNYTKNITIKYFDQLTGQQQTINKVLRYTVEQPTSVFVSADKVKVLYVGLDNPVSISAGAETNGDKISATISQGSLEKVAGGQYIARVNYTGIAKITVNVDGHTYTFAFKVKPVPPPTAQIGSLASGKVSANVFKSQAGVRADLQDFLFEGIKFDVVSYALVFSGKGFEQTGPAFATVSGAYFDSDAKDYMERCRAGSSVILTDVVVKGPGGTKKLEGAVAYYLIP